MKSSSSKISLRPGQTGERLHGETSLWHHSSWKREGGTAFSYGSTNLGREVNYFYGPCSIAMLVYQRVEVLIEVVMEVIWDNLTHLFGNLRLHIFLTWIYLVIHSSYCNLDHSSPLSSLTGPGIASGPRSKYTSLPTKWRTSIVRGPFKRWRAVETACLVGDPVMLQMAWKSSSWISN